MSPLRRVGGPLGRRTAFSLAFLLVLASLVSGCASTADPTPQLAVGATEREALLSPLEGYPLAIGATTERRIQQAYTTLITSGNTESVEELAAELLASNPGLQPATVLQAQVLTLAGAHDQALELLRPAVTELPTYTAGWVLLGWVYEQLDDVVGALLAYSKVAPQSSVAAERSARLRPRGAEILRNRIESDLAAGRLDDAARSLERLREVAESEDATLEAVASVARATGDSEQELTAIRELHVVAPDDRSITERRAELELETGDPSDGLRLMRQLAADYPRDPSIQEKAARAEFLWRLQLLPPDVREIAREPEVNRGDFATLVFWLFPEVRYGRVDTAKIANDVLEHPHRQEIVRVINLGLMDVDPSLHRFEPHRAIERVDALATMTRLLHQQSPRPACLGPRSARLESSRSQTCSQAAQCRLIASENDCLPSATMTGLEVVDLLRASQGLVANP